MTHHKEICPAVRDEETRKPHAAHQPRWTLLAAVAFVCLTWAACIWVAAHLDANPIPHKVTLFTHLGSLLVGFGAVLTIEYYGLLWLLGQRNLGQALGFARPLHMPVWVGLAGLALSGVLLKPDLDSPLTQTKLILVLIVTLNGIHVNTLQKRLAHRGEARPPQILLFYVIASSLVSQSCWWGAITIGFLNSHT